jgi:hypothetical protein
MHSVLHAGQDFIPFVTFKVGRIKKMIFVLAENFQTLGTGHMPNAVK